MAADYEVYALRYATGAVPASQVYLNYYTYGEPDHELVMDFFFWVVRNHDRTWVVDTGCTPEVAVTRNKTVTCTVPDGLARLGVDPAEVQGVVVTHGHWDHTGNLDLFDNAEFVMSGVELDFWSGPFSDRQQFRRVKEDVDVQRLGKLDADGRLTRFAGTHDAAPGISLIEVGGHTPGQVIVTVSGESGPVLLASDAVHYYDEVTLDRPFLIVSDLPRMYEAYDRIAALAAEPRMAYVAGHDPQVFDRFTPIDPADPGFGVRVA